HVDKGGKKIPVASYKPITGHSMGAVGAWETIIGCKILEEQVIPPTINSQPEGDYVVNPIYENIDVVREKREGPVNVVLQVNWGLGGQNGALLLARPDYMDKR
ncbi:hypothetical protein GF327_01335, partial [Candidatus Woesearchaeota archaeon]|nr:hypothetical protein [Candidatus Woesearchaeota archaeon]